MGLHALTVGTQRAKGRVQLTGAVDKSKELAVALLSLKRSSAELAFASNKWEPSKGMSMRLAWTFPEKPVELNQEW